MQKQWEKLIFHNRWPTLYQIISKYKILCHNKKILWILVNILEAIKSDSVYRLLKSSLHRSDKINLKTDKIKF